MAKPFDLGELRARLRVGKRTVEAMLRFRRAEQKAERLNRVLRSLHNVNQLAARDDLLQNACRSLIEVGGYHNALPCWTNRRGC